MAGIVSSASSKSPMMLLLLLVVVGHSARATSATTTTSSMTEETATTTSSSTSTTTSYYASSPASCSANVGCEGLVGDCCPTSYTGTFLDCCPTQDTPASCSAHEGCAGLTGDCCPSPNGQDLYCCYQNPDIYRRPEYTYYGHPNPSGRTINYASYQSSTGDHIEQQLANGGRRYTYKRNGSYQYDLLYFATNGKIVDANEYVTGVRKFYLTIESASNTSPCTEILLQLDSLPTATSDNYPKGRHSRYWGLYTPESKRVEFTFLDRPDKDVPDTAITHIALFFEPGTYAAATYEYTFLDSTVSCTTSAASVPTFPPVVYYPPPPVAYGAPPTSYPTKYPTKGAYYPPPPTPAPVAPYSPPPPTRYPTRHPVAVPNYLPPPAPVNYDDPVPVPVPVPAPIVVDDPATRPVPVPAPIRDDPATRPVPVPAPVRDDPATRPVPVPVPVMDDPVSRPTTGGMTIPEPTSMAGRHLASHEYEAQYVDGYGPFDNAAAVTTNHENNNAAGGGRQLTDYGDQCLPPPVNQCPARHVGVECSGRQEDCQNPACAHTPECSGYIVESFLALENRNSETVETSGSDMLTFAAKSLVMALLIGVGGVALF